MTGLSWMDRAACKGLPVGAFFSTNGSVTPQARAACNACGVRAECLGYALENDIRFGIWGGKSEADRQRMRRKAQRREREGAGAA